MNNYYNKSGAPATSAKAVSATMRTEFDSIETGFEKVSPLTGKASLPVFINSGATAQEAITLAAARTLLNVEDGADVTDAVNIASSIVGVAAKTTPVNADTVPIIDSAASSALKEVTWANIKATLKSYFDTLYNKYVHPNHSGEVTSAADGAQTIANKQTLSAIAPVTISNAPKVIGTAAPVIAMPAATGSVNGYATSTQITKLNGIETAADVTDAVNIASSIVGVAGKTTPANADTVPIIDSAASSALKELTWANVKATLKTYFDSLYSSTFVRGGTLVNAVDYLSAINTVVWYATETCTVTNVRGYRVGGTGATINARKNGSSNHLSSALSLASADTWTDGGAVQNTGYVAGNKLEIMVVSVSGDVEQIGIQIDFVRA